MYCKKCGKQLPDGTKFCSGCGAPVAPSDPNATVILEPPVSQQPAAPGTAPNSWPSPGSGYQVPGSIPVIPETGSSAKPGKEKKGKGRAGLFVGIGAAVVAVVVLVVLGIKFLPGLFGGGGSDSAIVYLSSDGELMYLANLKEKTEALEIEDDLDKFVQLYFSPDGKNVYFADSENTLYAASVSALKKGDGAERVAKGVPMFFSLNDGRLLYLQSDDGGQTCRLNIYEKGESYRVVKNLTYYDFQLSEDQKTLYYIVRDLDKDTMSLYKTEIKEGAEAERLLKDVSRIYSRYSAETLVYSVNKDTDRDTPSGIGDRNTVVLYSCAPGGEAKKLSDGAYAVLEASVEDGKMDIYYTVEDVEQHTLYDFVTDSTQAEDAAILSQPEMEYPSWSDFYPDELYIEGETVYYENGKGDRYPINVSSLMTPGKELSDLPYYQMFNIAYEDASDRYSAASEEYNTWYDNWYAAQHREGMRSDLKDTDYSRVSYILYHETGNGSPEDIADGLSMGYIQGSGGVFLYHKTSRVGGTGAVADLSELSYYSQVYDLIGGDSGSNRWYQNVGGNESVLTDLGEDDYVYSTYIFGSGAAMTVGSGDRQELQVYSIGRDALTYSDTIAEGRFSVYYTSPDEDSLYVFADLNNREDYSAGDLCVYKNGKLTTIAEDVHAVAILAEGGTTYLETDCDSHGSAELALQDGKKASKIAEGVTKYIPLDETRLLYIRENNLYLWDGEDNRRMAKNVETFWAGKQAAYFLYTAN